MNNIKFVLLFAIIGLLPNSTKAQFYEGTSFSYSSLSGERYNPGIHPVGGGTHDTMWVATMIDEMSENIDK